MFPGGIVLLIIAFFLLLSMVKILREYERGVVFRLGRSIGVKGPGLILLIPLVDTMRKIDMRIITMDIQPQDAITKDNVTIKVNAVVYFRVTDAEKAVIQIEDYYFATAQLAQTTLRSVLGQVHMDQLLENRDSINHRLQDILDRQTENWGIKISAVEIKDIDMPKEMQRAMAREAEAERERRAKVISAEGEVQRSQLLADAANTMASPTAIQLAYLQTLTEITKDRSSTIIFPLPMDILTPFIEAAKKHNKEG